jgi:hypothetical protein
LSIYTWHMGSRWYTSDLHRHHWHWSICPIMVPVCSQKMTQWFTLKSVANHLPPRSFLMGKKGWKPIEPNCQSGLWMSMVLLRSYTPTSLPSQSQTQSFIVQLNAALISTVMWPSVGLTCTTCCPCAIHTLKQEKSSCCKAG